MTDTKDNSRTAFTLSAAFFLSTTADTASNSFLPVIARGLGGGVAWLSSEMAAGLPTATFWLMVAAAQLTTARWERHRDHRHLMITALAASIVAQALSATADNVFALSAWRGLGGFAAGIVMILVQDGLLRLGTGGRTRASGNYLGIFFAGTITGTLGGGAIAGWGGATAAFLAAAFAAAFAMGLAWALPSFRDRAVVLPFRPTALLRNPAFAALVLVGAIPSRLLISAFLYVLVPLRLHGLDFSPARISMVMIAYSAIMALTAPVWSRLVDRLARPLAFTLAGLALSALALVLAAAGPWAGLDARVATVAAVIVLGVAQAMGMAPQVTVLFDVAAGEVRDYGRTAVLGLFRVFERVGLFVGPLLAGLASPDHALIILAVMAALAVPALATTLALARRQERAGPSPAPETIP